MCAKYYELKYMLQNSVKIRVIFGAWFKEKLIKQTYMKTETCKLYSSLLKISAKCHENILSYTVSKLVHFLKHSVDYVD